MDSNRFITVFIFVFDGRTKYADSLNLSFLPDERVANIIMDRELHGTRIFDENQTILSLFV